MLINKWFLQVLEGSAVNINSLFKVIENDPRHADFLLLRFNAVEARDFSDWSMASIEVDEQRFINIANQAAQCVITAHTFNSLIAKINAGAAASAAQ